jgi:hypothetical protein
VVARVQTIPIGELDPGLQECLRSHDRCQAFVYALRRIRGQRVGNFLADFFNFRRKVDQTGWRFNALLVMVDDRLSYKLWSGQPRVEIFSEERNLLGPLQGFGNQVVRLLPW